MRGILSIELTNPLGDEVREIREYEKMKGGGSLELKE
jgi:hypothetical protein